MPAALRVQLLEEEARTLSELRIASEVPYRVRDRAHMLLLNDDGWSAPTIAGILKCHEHTVRAAIKQWEKEGLYGLWSKEGRGRKPTWEASDLAAIEQWLDEEERTYNSRQLAEKLWEERQVKLSPDRIRKLLKKNYTDGNGHAKVTVTGKTPQPVN